MLLAKNIMKKIIYTKDIIPGIIIDMRMFMIKIKLWEDKYIIIFTNSKRLNIC